MFASILIGFIAGMIVAMVVLVMSGNPRADQLESELAVVKKDWWESGREYNREISELKHKLAAEGKSNLAALQKLLEWEDWAKQIPNRPQRFTATSVRTTA